MPLYEYQCQSCGSRFERIERASSPHDGVCPDCGGAAHRLLGAPALQFKGSGWYVTDYAKGTASQPSEGEKEKAASSASSSETAREKKTAPKPEKSNSKKADHKVA